MSSRAIRCACPAALVAVGALSASAFGQVINADYYPGTSAAHPGAILDQGTGLLWLDATETANRSLADVQGRLGPGQEFEGWRVATSAEIHALWNNLGFIETFPCCLGWTIDAAQRLLVDAFLDIYGDTGAAVAGYNGTDVWYAESVADNGSLLVGRRNPDEYWVGNNFGGPVAQASLRYGVALVRDFELPPAPAPGPGLYALSNLNELLQLDTSTAAGANIGLVTQDNNYSTEFEYDAVGQRFVKVNFNGSALIFADPVTRQATGFLNVVMPGTTNSITALEFVGGQLYGAASVAAGNTTDSRLIRIDTTNGAADDLGVMVTGGPVTGLAWDGDAMYAVNGGGSSSTLYQVNLTNAQTTPIGSVIAGTPRSLTGLEFGNDGELYGLARPLSANRLLRIDPATGSAVDIGQITGSTAWANGLTTIPSHDAGLFVIENNADFIASVDPATATLTDMSGVVPGLNSFYSEIEYADGYFYVADGSSTLNIINIIDASSYLPVNSFNAANVVISGQNITALEAVGGRLFVAASTRASSNPSVIAKMDRATGVLTALGPTGVPGPVNGLTHNGAVLYASSGNPVNTGVSRLCTVNMATGAAVVVGDITVGGVPVAVTDIEFGADGVLYGVERFNGTRGQERLLRIDPATGAATRIAQFNGLDATNGINGITAVDPGLIASNPLPNVGADYVSKVSLTSPPTLIGPRVAYSGGVSTSMAVGPTEIVAQGSGSFSPLRRMDRATGAPLPTLTLSYPPDRNINTALEFVGETLFSGLGTSGGDGFLPSYLARIDRVTGVITVVGPTGFNGPLGGLAYDGSRMLGVNSAASGPATLYEINLATGAATPLHAVLDAATGAAMGLTGLCYTPDGRLWGLTQETALGGGPGDGRLYRIDPETGFAYDQGKIQGDVNFNAISAPPRAPVKGVTNPSFESGAFDAWATADMPGPLWPVAVRPAGAAIGYFLWTTAPTDGAFSATHGFDGQGPGTIVFSQDLLVHEPGLLFDYRAAWSIGGLLDRKIDAVVRALDGTELQRTGILVAPGMSNLPDTGVQRGRVNISSFVGMPVNVAIESSVPEVYTGPGQFEADNFCQGAAPCTGDVTTTNTNPGDAGYGTPDGTVDGADLSFYVEAWLNGFWPVADVTTTNTNPGDPGYGQPDGTVDGADLSYYVEAWLNGCP